MKLSHTLRSRMLHAGWVYGGVLGKCQMNVRCSGPPEPIFCRRTDHSCARPWSSSALPGSMGRAWLLGCWILCGKAPPVRAKLSTRQLPALSLLPSSHWHLPYLPFSLPGSITLQLPSEKEIGLGHMLNLKQILVLEGNSFLHWVQWVEEQREEKEDGGEVGWCLCATLGGIRVGGWRKLLRRDRVESKGIFVVYLWSVCGLGSKDGGARERDGETDRQGDRNRRGQWYREAERRRGREQYKERESRDFLECATSFLQLFKDLQKYLTPFPLKFFGHKILK